MLSKKYYISISILLLLLTSLATQAQDCGEYTIAEMQREYRTGNFTEVVKRLSVCIQSGSMSIKQVEEAYSLLAKTQLELDEVDQANLTIKSLLSINPSYEPAFNDPLKYKVLIEGYKQRTAQTTVVSVSKKAEQIELTPATVAVITANDIRNRGYLDVEALFYDLSGFDISRSMGITYSNLYQRGYRSAAASDRTMLLIDGVEDNELWTNFAWISRQYAISNIKRVEVIYGPASTIYGANAFCGVVNIVTKDESDFFERVTDSKGIYNHLKINAQTSYGSYNSRFADLSAAVRHKDMFFTITSRVYKSDEMDLSEYDAWNYTFNRNDFNDQTYQKKLGIAGTDINGNYYAHSYYKKRGLPLNNPYYNVTLNDTTVTSITPTLLGIQKAREFDSLYYETPGNDIYFTNQKTSVDISAKLSINDFTFGFQWWKSGDAMTPTYTDLWLTSALKGSVWNVKQYFFYAKYNKYLSNKFNISNITTYRVNGVFPDNRVTDYHSYINGDYSIADLLIDRKPTWRTTYLYEASWQMRNELKFLYIATKNFDIVGGIEYRSSAIPGNYVSSTNKDQILDGTSPNVPGGNIYNSTDIGAYIQASQHIEVKKLGGDLYLTAGTRYDYNEIRGKYGYGSAFNPRLSAVYKQGKLIIKTIYAEAFKDASNFNKFSTSATRLLNNPNLEPEKVRNTELNIRWQYTPNGYVEFVGYNAIYTNVLETAIVEYQGSKTTQFKGIGRIDAQGLQVISQASIAEKYQIYANYTFTYPYKIVGEKRIRMGDIAEHQFNIGANGQFFNDKLTANLRMNLVGSKETGKNTTIIDNPLNQIDGFMLLNGAVTYNNFVPGLSLQLVVNNILNKEYFHPGIRSADGIQYAAFLPQYRRSFFVRVLFDLVPFRKHDDNYQSIMNQ